MRGLGQEPGGGGSSSRMPHDLRGASWSVNGQSEGLWGRWGRAAMASWQAICPPRCGACGAPVAGALGALCAACLSACLPAPDAAPARAAWAYAGPIAESLRRAKFRPELGALRALLPGACARLARPAAGEAVAICFVPVHARRLFVRGFDPAAVVARALAESWGLPLFPAALANTRLDPPLSLGADVARRARVVAGRYRAHEEVAGRALVVVDDVVTTGATLREASRTLRRAGALSVELVALAATP